MPKERSKIVRVWLPGLGVSEIALQGFKFRHLPAGCRRGIAADPRCTATFGSLPIGIPFASITVPTAVFRENGLGGRGGVMLSVYRPEEVRRIEELGKTFRLDPAQAARRYEQLLARRSDRATTRLLRSLPFVV